MVDNKTRKTILVISGQSGSGKTACIQVLLDLNYLILSSLNSDNYYDVVNEIINNSKNEKIAIILNVINKEKFSLEYEIMKKIINQNKEYENKRIFLKANLATLVNRYHENRKIHPYAYYNDMKLDLKNAIKIEKEITKKFEYESDFVIDTSTLAVIETKKILLNYLNEEKRFTINIYSFGFKYGSAPDSDFSFDLRFLPNPFYEKKLKLQTGEDKAVRDFVFKTKISESIYNDIKDILLKAIPGYEKVGKVLVNVGFGCTGGRHRSVAFAYRLESELKEKYSVNLIHLEKEREHWT